MSSIQPRIGVDLGGTKTEVIVLSAEGESLWRQRRSTPARDYNAILDAIVTLVRDAKQDCELPPDLPVGVATPGAVSLKTGLMKNSNTTSLNGRNLSSDLATKLNSLVRIANDADCFALSEASDGAGTGASTMFGAILGTGVGGGICLDGRLLRGVNAIAGEWGHNTLPLAALRDFPAPPEAGSRQCYCGRFDCVEQWLSGPAFERQFLVLTGQRLSAADIEARCAAGEPDAVLVSRQYCNLLALAMAAVINIVDPHTIVLGGGMSNLPAIYEQVFDYLPNYVFSDQIQTRIVPAKHGDSSGVRGAAWLWQIEEIYH